MRSLCKTHQPLIGALAGVTILVLVSWILASPGHRSAATTDQGDLIVHEWGSFLSVQGSDGVTLGGIIDS